MTPQQGYTHTKWDSADTISMRGRARSYLLSGLEVHFALSSVLER
jgi:hypothetical protein